MIILEAEETIVVKLDEKTTPSRLIETIYNIQISKIKTIEEHQNITTKQSSRVYKQNNSRHPR